MSSEIQRTSNAPQFAFIALGSNLGNSRETILRVVVRLQAFSDEPLIHSSLWKTEPVQCPPDSPPFINAVVKLSPRADETPEALFEKLQALEKEFGRAPGEVRNAPRPLDLDLIAFGGVIRNTERLTLPHPRAHQRRFVLAPLEEIAPDYIFPGQGETVRELLRKLGDQQEVVREG
jgi:2-amino-4-hydroxy-6-hydroxymethyldihydropteridine diphosphokinase